VSGNKVEEPSESCDWASWGSLCGGNSHADASAKVVRFARGEARSSGSVTEALVGANEESSHLS
jgi:hypothetical protein